MLDIFGYMEREFLSRRILELERREKGFYIEGDFEGTVTGYWKQKSDDGTGTVVYGDKEYDAVPLGFTSLPEGVPVELSYSSGIYYAKW